MDLDHPRWAVLGNAWALAVTTIFFVGAVIVTELTVQDTTVKILIAAVSIIFITFAGIAVIAIYRFLAFIKKINFLVVSDLPILSPQVGEGVEGRFKILFDNPVSNLRIAVIKISNIGNQTIAPEDYKEPVSIDFGDNSEIFDVELLYGTGSTNLSFTYNKQKITLAPILLKIKDTFEFKVLLTTPQPLKGKVRGSIDGIKQLPGLAFAPARPSGKSVNTDLGLSLVYIIVLIVNAIALFYLSPNFGSSEFLIFAFQIYTPFGVFPFDTNGVLMLLQHISSIMDYTKFLIIINLLFFIIIYMRILRIIGKGISR